MAMGVCQVFVNHAYKLIYIRHPKTGSSSLLCHFNGCNGTDLDAAHPTQDPLSFQILNALARVSRGVHARIAGLCLADVPSRVDGA